MPSHDHGSSSAPYISQNTTYMFENVKGDTDGIYLDGQLIISEKCVGMNHSYSKDVLLFFDTMGDKSTIHLFEKKESDTSFMLLEQTISIDGKNENHAICRLVRCTA